MLMADFNISPDSLGVWVICLAFIMLVAERVKATFWPNTAYIDENVRRSELLGIQSSLSEYVKRVELERLEQQISGLAVQYKELSVFSHSRVQALSDAVNAMQVRLEVMHRDIDKDIDSLADRLLSRIEESSKQIVVVSALLEKFMSVAKLADPIIMEKKNAKPN